MNNWPVALNFPLYKLFFTTLLLFTFLNLHGSPGLIEYSPVANDSIVRRQHFAMKINFAHLFLVTGIECSANYAIKNNVHFVACASAYTQGTLIGFNPTVPPRYGYSVTGELRWHKAVRSTFTGFFVGPFYAFRGGYFEYLTTDFSVNGEYYWSGHAIGLIGGMAICPKRHPRFIFEFYFGYGRMLSNKVVRSVQSVLYPPTVASDEVRNNTANYPRAGLSIGFAF